MHSYNSYFSLSSLISLRYLRYDTSFLRYEYLTPFDTFHYDAYVRLMNAAPVMMNISHGGVCICMLGVRTGRWEVGLEV